MATLSIYQIIHTLDGVIFHLEQHLKLLFEAYYEIFGSGVRLQQPAIEEQIKAAIVRSRAPRGVSLFVRLEIFEGGKIVITESDRSLYCGYSLRCISPRAALVDFAIPHITCPTSVREQAVALANVAARRKGCDLALRRSGDYIDMVNGAQIFAAKGEVVITATDSYSVEHQFAKQLLKNEGVNLVERPIRADELTTFDELFFIDHHGVTALKGCESAYYMSITASSVATLLSRFIG
ncbi:MAG: aminotransferase class IV [Rikenellaceae bacterium]